MSALKNEADFELPVGFLDRSTGILHRTGRLRLINQKDRMIAYKLASELFETLGSELNPAYAHFVDLILLSRAIISLEGFPINDLNRQNVVESLIDVDKSYLENLHDRLALELAPANERQCPLCGQDIGRGDEVSEPAEKGS